VNERFEQMVDQVLNYRPPKKKKKGTKNKMKKKKTSSVRKRGP